MRRRHWILGLLVVIVALAISTFAWPSKSKTLADVSSPTGAWRVVVMGKDVWGGIEVSGAVHTRDGREVPLGVIDLRREWGETEYEYQADPIHHTRIDETKAIVGDRLLLRDDFFPDESHTVLGQIANQPVQLRIGEANNMGFHLKSSDKLISLPSVTVHFMDFQDRLADGAIFEAQTTDKKIIPPHITCYWEEQDSQQFQIASLYQDFSLRIKIEEVTPYIVKGKMQIHGANPDVDLAGDFRLVNKLSSNPSQENTPNQR